MKNLQNVIAAIQGLDNDELDQVVEAVRMRRTFIARSTVRSLRVGDTVSFDAGPRRGVRVGKVIKVNRKNVKVQEAGYGTWNVPANLLTVTESA